MAKKTLFKLPFETDFRITGVFCRENDYRFTWMLNKHLMFDFRRVADFEFARTREEQPSRHSVFYFDQPTLMRTFFLVNNRSAEGQSIFTNPPALDFLLLVKAEGARFSSVDLLRNLRAISQVTAAYQLDDALGRHKEAFLYDFELFLSLKIKS
ncbi:MAG: IPExxxVDY family protein [Bacteroidota bacterium]